MPDNNNQPDEINPEHVADRIRCEVILRDPSLWTEDADGNRTYIAPDPQLLTWSPIPVIAEPANCRHDITICAKCGDSWGLDHYTRFYMDGVLVNTAADFPQEPAA